jgi:hypothetical protein
MQKIKTHQNASNFITHDLWSKTKLATQHIHLELPYILGYAITKKIKHISRINIFVKYKIVINSPEVHFGPKIQHAEVGHKNLIIFSYRNHLNRFWINRKQFIIKYLQHNFVQFLVQELGMTQTNNISKIHLQRTCRFGDITDLGLLIFYFSYKIYQEKLWICFTKVVVIFTKNPTKLSLHFSDFPMIFYAFYKNQQIGFTI